MFLFFCLLFWLKHFNFNIGTYISIILFQAGAIAGTIVDVALFPLDTLKTRLQSQYGFIQSGGFKGIYKGLTPTIIGAPFTGKAILLLFIHIFKKISNQYVSAGLFFGTYDGFKNLFPNVSSNTAPIVHLCAGIVGEVVQY